MKYLIKAICSLLIGLLIHSCTKDKMMDSKAFLECNNAMQLDTAGIANKLIGTWKLKSWYCGECTNPGTHYSDKIILATFTSARSFSVTENAIVVAEGYWSLRIVDSNKWGLQSDSSLTHLYGAILFCDDQVLFYDSYLDGKDNLFDRVN